MARFALAEQSPPVASMPEACQLLREVASHLQAAIKDTTRATNRLHNLLARVFPELPMKVKKINSGLEAGAASEGQGGRGAAGRGENDRRLAERGHRRNAGAAAGPAIENLPN